jgi:predicted ferric reductase
MGQFLRWIFITFYLLSPSLPVTVFFLAKPERPIGLLHAVAIAAGITAFCWFCYQFISSARVKIIHKTIGTETLYRFHRLAPLGIFLLVFIHANLMKKFLPKEDGLMDFFGSSAIYIYIGIAIFSLIFMGGEVLDRVGFFQHFKKIVTRVLPPIRYERIRFIHNVAIVAAVMMLIHVLLLPLPGLIAFKLLMSLIFCIALIHYLYHKRWRTAYLRRHPYVIRTIEAEADNIWTLQLVPASGHLLSFKAGQYIYLMPLSSYVKAEEHPFSISSAPGERDSLTVTIKASGDFTSTIGDIRPGDRAMVDGPYGNFTLMASAMHHQLVFLAGGIGITPFLSMLRSLRQTAPSREVILIWNVRTRRDLIQQEVIEVLLRDMPKFTFVPVLSRDCNWGGREGRIDTSLLLQVLGSDPGTWTATDFFICGPPSMIDSCKTALNKLGIVESHIHSERFAV